MGMVHFLLKQDMTVYELAQFMIDYCASKEDVKLLEKRLTQKIDNNYIHTNKRIDLIS